jgi:ferredoxin
MNSKELKNAAKKMGADLIGIASVERFKDQPPEVNPLSIFPECKSVIVLGRRILRGSLRGVEEGTNFNSTYGMFGLHWLEDSFLSKTSYDLTCWIEERKFEAVPLFGYQDDQMNFGVPVAEGKPAPNVIVDLDFAAQAAGLAEMGLGGFLLTPEFGTRQRFACILTDCELEPDEIRNKSICSDCGACAEACPLGAIKLEKTTNVGVPGHEMSVAEIDYAICRKCQNGAANVGWKGKGNLPDRIAAACGRACLVKLETAGKCQTFENKFRNRSPWALDALGNPVADSSDSKSTAYSGCGAASKSL